MEHARVDDEALAYDVAVAIDPYMSQAAALSSDLGRLRQDLRATTEHSAEELVLYELDSDETRRAETGLMPNWLLAAIATERLIALDEVARGEASNTQRRYRSMTRPD